jgi:hypothetical protein
MGLVTALLYTLPRYTQGTQGEEWQRHGLLLPSPIFAHVYQLCINAILTCS